MRGTLSRSGDSTSRLVYSYGAAVQDRSPVLSLLTVGGAPITSTTAGDLLGALEAGEAVVFEVRRGDTIVAVHLTPRASGERRQRI